MNNVGSLLRNPTTKVVRWPEPVSARRACLARGHLARDRRGGATVADDRDSVFTETCATYQARRGGRGLTEGAGQR
jgi:hypothetical protein